jgi:hypothetical protein
VISNTLAIAQALLMKRFRAEPEPAGKKKKKATEELEASGLRGFLASTQASLTKLLGAPPESDNQGSNSGKRSKDQSDQSSQKKADAKGS